MEDTASHRYNTYSSVERAVRNRRISLVATLSMAIIWVMGIGGSALVPSLRRSMLSSAPVSITFTVMVGAALVVGSIAIGRLHNMKADKPQQ